MLILQRPADVKRQWRDKAAARGFQAKLAGRTRWAMLYFEFSAEMATLLEDPIISCFRCNTELHCEKSKVYRDQIICRLCYVQVAPCPNCKAEGSVYHKLTDYWRCAECKVTIRVEE